MKKYWIYDEQDEKFIIVNEDRLDFTYDSKYPYSHLKCNRIKYAKRICEKTGKILLWEYVYFGETRSECWLHATYYIREKINKLENEMKHLKKQLAAYGEQDE